MMGEEIDNDATSLTNYLCQAYLPRLMLDETLPPEENFATAWDRMEELNMDSTRLIRQVSEIPLLALQNAVRLYFMGFQNRLHVDWANTRLKLPSPGMTILTNAAISRLGIESESDFLAALEHFPLDTAAEALRTVEGRPFDEDELKFSRLKASSARSTKKLWSIYTFGPHVLPTGVWRPGVVILALPPWQLGIGDLHEFASRRVFTHGELDREPAGTTAWSNATKLWAMLYDTSRVSGYRWFVITTYNSWVFGTWSLDWSAAEVTRPIPFDRTRGMSIVELLTFWIECARDKTRFWHVATNAPPDDMEG
ncbi:hypothetical protein C8Q78DRAFT_1067214 [Trametes maxima]|nr:hypothetical protein C8Q78DRAFT_1067214 [Trametes maxima]